MRWQQKLAETFGVYMLCAATVIVVLSNSAAYGAGVSAPKARISSAADKFDGVTQFVTVIDYSARGLLGAHHNELAVGVISASSGNELFASIGPVWRIHSAGGSFFTDVSIAPTLISGSRFRGRDLGGYFHFTSSVSVGKRVGRAGSLALRIQHTSNGGLSDTNPGMDMLGLEFSFEFSE